MRSGSSPPRPCLCSSTASLANAVIAAPARTFRGEVRRWIRVSVQSPFGLAAHEVFRTSLRIEVLRDDGQSTGNAFRVMHPVLLLESRVHNMMGLFCIDGADDELRNASRADRIRVKEVAAQDVERILRVRVAEHRLVGQPFLVDDQRRHQPPNTTSSSISAGWPSRNDSWAASSGSRMPIGVRILG